jgi:endonuclease I
VVNFTPSASGTRNAVLTLTNNDATNSSYVINLNGIGGNLATQPTAQATNLTFPMAKSYHIQGGFTAASPAADGYLVLRKTGSAITDVPVSGTVYQRGDYIGSSQVVYCSNATGFFPNNIVANTTYYFAVFAYNGVSTYRNYLTTAPLTGSVTTSGSMQATMHPTYYNTVSTANTTFVADLHNAITTHTLQWYSYFGNMVIEPFYVRDTTGNQRVITCVYSGENKVFTEPFDWTTENFSREHTYCESWMPTYSCTVYQNNPEYNDFHLITPTDQNNANALRSNYPLGVVAGTPTYTYLGCKLGNDANGHKVWEPRNSDKGSAARHMLYECISYTSITPTCTPLNTSTTWGGSWSLPSICYTGVPYGQDQTVLKQWNDQYPPDNFEIALNDFIDSLQGNRNPFVDHPEYVCYIDFSTMTYLATPSSPCPAATGINEISNQFGSALVYPNPANNSFTILIGENKSTNANVSIMNMIGEQVASFSNLENYNGMIDCSNVNIANGLYIVKINSGEKTFVSRVMINK